MLATIAAEVKGSGPTVSGTHCFAPKLPDPWLLQLFYPLFLSGPWTLEGRGAVCFPLWLSTPQTLLCSLTICEFLPYPLSTILRTSLWGLSSASLLHSLMPNRLLFAFLSCSQHFTYQGNHGLCETVKVMFLSVFLPRLLPWSPHTLWSYYEYHESLFEWRSSILKEVK